MILLRNVSLLREGDRLDLAYDPYADPPLGEDAEDWQHSSHILLENEYQRVYSVDVNAEATVVSCDDFVCGFPSSHRVRVDVCDWGVANAFADCAGFVSNMPGDDGASLGTFCDVHQDAVESGGMPSWLSDELTGLQYNPDASAGRLEHVERLANLGWVIPTYTVDDRRGETYVTIGHFTSEDDASSFIATLPEYQTGRYGISGPNPDA